MPSNYKPRQILRSLRLEEFIISVHMPLMTYSLVSYTPEATKLSLRSRKGHTTRLDLTSISHSPARYPGHGRGYNSQSNVLHRL